MKKILIPVFSLLCLLGCNVLDKEPLPTIAPQNFFRNADDAEAAITAAYDGLQATGYYGQDMNVVGEMPSDNVTSTNGDVAAMEQITWTPQTSQVNNVFRDIYIAINRTNSVLKYVPAIEMNEERKNQILGEAYFLRGLHYFNLVRLYGGVPLRLDPTESGESGTVAMAQSTPEQVYTQIISDLRQAAQLTAPDFGNGAQNRTRAIKTAVNALQTRVFLTQGQWQQAITAATNVISSNMYQLAPEVNELYPPNNHPESIFEVQFSANADGGFILPDLLLPSPPATYSFPKFNIPTQELIQFADTVIDERWKFTGQVTNAGHDHVSFVISTSDNPNDNGYFVYKWRSPPNAFNSPDNYYVFRLADVLLMHAEASNELNGPSQVALDNLNAVRQRAGLPALTLIDLPTQQDFRNEVDRQRRLELAFEGERWFDLIRYARYETANPSVNHPVTALDIIQARQNTPNQNYLLFPFPQNELNNNALLQQNQGY